MKDNSGSGLTTENQNISSFKEGLADFLTASRAVISLVILSLSFVGKEAYIAVVILSLFGATTDIFDGKMARHYLGENRHGKLGKYDLAIDTLLVLCILGYFSLAGIVIPQLIGLTWIGLAVIVSIVLRMKVKVLASFEVSSILGILTIAGIYDLRLFGFVIMPAIFVGMIVNRDRLRYVLFDKIPNAFSE